jgi:hypothetical protein
MPDTRCKNIDPRVSRQEYIQEHRCKSVDTRVSMQDVEGQMLDGDVMKMPDEDARVSNQEYRTESIEPRVLNQEYRTKSIEPRVSNQDD